MLERMEKQQHDMHSSLLEQRQQLQAQEEDLATWKADAQRQLDIQQVCMCFIAGHCQYKATGHDPTRKTCASSMLLHCSMHPVMQQASCLSSA